MTVTGTGFTASTSIQAGGTVEPTTYVSSTQVSALISASQLASGANLTIIALNGTSASSGSAVSLVVNNPSPTISAIVPAAVPAGSQASTVAITGTGFVPVTAIQVGGSARSTAFVSSTQMNVNLTAADLANPGNLSLTAVNPSPGGGTSAAASVAINSPAPGAITLAPATVAAGATTATTVTVTGTNFLASSTVEVGPSSRPTTFVSSTQLAFQLTVADQATPGHLEISVVTPGPGGGTSPAASLAVTGPSPAASIYSVSPNQFYTGSADTTVVVQGNDFTAQSVIEWNGSPLATSLQNLNGFMSLVGQVPASLLAAAGTASVAVSTPSVTPALSNSLTVTITDPPTPTLSAVFPNSAPIHTSTVITINGTGFVSDSTVAFNGVNLPTTYNSSYSLSATLPASVVEVPGTGSLTVTTPSPGGGTTQPAGFTAYIGITNNSMIYDPVNGLFYVSVPSSAGAPYGNSVVSVDPATGALGTPIPVGSEPNVMAMTSDGKYLWVGLDGASAVRQVDLTTGKAGLQFSLGQNGGIYASPATALALAALPGQPNSVVVSLSSGEIAIYDSGVVRPDTVLENFADAYGLAVDGTRDEIYAAGSAYSTYAYTASGLSLKATSTTSTTYASYFANEIDLSNGVLYTDFGQAFDAESGSLLGTFYSSGTNAAYGPVVVDPALGKLFVLDSDTGAYGSYDQIQTFSTTDYNMVGSGVIPIEVGSGIQTPYASRLTRWGADGLAFRTSVGVFSVRSNLVKDLSSTVADLGVTLSNSGAAAAGSDSTYTATVSNAGPTAATEVALIANLPSSAVLVSVAASAGSCSSGAVLTCDLGTVPSGGSATVTFVVQQITVGSATMSVSVSSSETDSNAANNQASSAVAVSGSSNYNVVPSIVSLNPASIPTGSPDTTLTVNGSGFASDATIQIDGTAVPTAYVSSTEVTAAVPAAKAASLGWSTVAVSNPAPGGGVSAALPLSYYSVITLGVNHILYDPYSRKIMASVGSGSSTVTGNSLVAITPETATVGTPVPIGSQPENLALSSDGEVLYTILSGSDSIARFNMLTGTAAFSFALPSSTNFSSTTPRWVAAQPGDDNVIAVDLGSYNGDAIFDVNPTAQTGTIRGSTSGPYTGSCLAFLDPADLLSFDIDTSGATLNHVKVTANGLSYASYGDSTSSTLNHFGCFKLDAGLAYSISGGVADPSTTPATQLGVFAIPSSYGYSGLGDVAPDTSLQRTFFAVLSTANESYEDGVDSIEAFDNNTYLPSTSIPLNFATVEGNTEFTVPDLIRWGQDGLAALTSSGHIYLVRGPGVVPQLLNKNTAATLSSSSASVIMHGAGNTLLTLTGTNFIPGVAVLWNGSYRTTTIVDATHLSVAIAASDLASAGTASLAVVNPGAAASSTLTLKIQ